MILSYILFAFYVALLLFLFVAGAAFVGIGSLIWTDKELDGDSNWKTVSILAVAGGLVIMYGAAHVSFTVLPVMWGSVS